MADSSSPPPLPPPAPTILPPPPPSVATLPKQTSGLAIASMVMGIAGLLFQLLAIPAVVCGHLALSTIKRSQARLTGSGFAVAGLVLGYLEVVLVVAAVVFFVSHFDTKPRPANTVDTSTSSFDLSRVALPNFPELPDSVFQTLSKSGVRVAQVDFRAANPGTNVLPGSRMKIRIYLPPGEHAPHSLTCVLVAPAGTNMLVGRRQRLPRRGVALCAGRNGGDLVFSRRRSRRRDQRDNQRLAGRL